jgi:hypothetical protein
MPQDRSKQRTFEQAVELRRVGVNNRSRPQTRLHARLGSSRFASMPDIRSAMFTPTRYADSLSVSSSQLEIAPTLLSERSAHTRATLPVSVSLRSRSAPSLH